MKVNPWFGRLRSNNESLYVSILSSESGVKSTNGKEKLDQSITNFYVSLGHSSDDES